MKTLFVRSAWLLAICITVFGFSACKTTKTVQSQKEVKKARKASEVVAVANKTLIDPTHFEGEGMLRFDRPDLDMTFQMLIRMEKDEMVWASLKKLGFEVARVKIDRDSIFLIDRFNKTVSTASNKQLMQSIGLTGEATEGAALPSIQAMILGKVLQFSDDASLVKTDSIVRVSNTLPAGKYYYEFTDLLVPSKLKIEAPARNIDFIEKFDNYQYVSDSSSIFSFDRFFNIQEKETTTKINIQFKNLNLNEAKKMPFSIPSRYRRKALF